MKLKEYPLIRTGSAKEILRIAKNVIGLRATKKFSCFDVGESKDEIPGKDIAITECADKSFQIAKKLGLPTHYIERIDDITIAVKETRIIKNRFPAGDEANYLVPVEFIYRNFPAGGIRRDLISGKKKPEDYGLPAGEIPPITTQFPFPVHHPTTKLESFDRDFKDNDEVCLTAGISRRELAIFWSLQDVLMGAIRLEMINAGFILLDGKCEFRMDPNRKPEFIDYFGTPDEDRPVLLDKFKNGIIEHYSKEYLREYFIEIGYYETVQKARATKQPDPPYPPLPEKIKAEASRRFIAVAEAYAGNKIQV